MLTVLFGLLLSANAFAQQLTVKGVVKDQTGEPVIGANVLVKGTTNGMITNINGEFTLSASKGDVIQVTIGSFTADPTTNQYAKVGAGGKLTAQSTNASADFQILGTEPIDIGGEAVTGYILMKLA